MAKISVLISTFNDGPELKAALCSIFHQTLQDFEIVIVDDCSTRKETKDILLWASRDSRVRLAVNETNIGFSASLNKGIKLCSSDYIARMDSDDISLTQRFEKQSRYLDENPSVSFCGTSFFLFDEQGIWGLSIMPVMPTLFDSYRNSCFCHPSVMMRKKDVISVGGYTVWQQGTRMAEDYDLWCKMLIAGKIGKNLEEPLLEYRETSHSYSKRKLIYQYHLAGLKKTWRKRCGFCGIYDIFSLKDICVGILPRFLYKNYHRKAFIKRYKRWKTKNSKI